MKIYFILISCGLVFSCQNKNFSRGQFQGGGSGGAKTGQGAAQEGASSDPNQKSDSSGGGNKGGTGIDTSAGADTDCSTAEKRSKVIGTEIELNTAALFALTRDHFNFRHTLYWNTADEAAAMVYNGREANLLCNLAGYEAHIRADGSHYNDYKDNWIWQYQHANLKILGGYRYDALKIDGLRCRGLIKESCMKIEVMKTWIDLDPGSLK